MKLENSKENIFVSLKNKMDKDTLIRLIFYAITLCAIVLKGTLLLGFILNKDFYTFDFWLGFENANYYFLFYAAFTAIFLSIALLFKNKGKFISLIVIDIFITLIMLVDLWYFRGFTTVPSILIVTQTANLDNMSGSITSMISRYDFLFLFDFVILIIGYIFFKSSFKKAKSNWKGFVIALLISVGYIGYIPFCEEVLNINNLSKSYVFSNYDPTNTAKYFSSIGYHIFDIVKVYKDSKPYDLTDEELSQIDNFYKQKNENLPDNKYKGLFEGKNLIVIQVESLESFVIGRSVDGQEITPNLNKMLNNSIYFPNVFEQVNEGTSSDSDLMVNTSMLPLRQGSTFFRYPNTTYNSFPNLLEKEKSYSTVAMHPDKGSFWNYAQGLTGIGFDQFVDYFSFDTSDIIGLGMSDESYFRQVVPKLKELQEPFYSFNVTLTSHGPFDLPKDLRELTLDPELEKNNLGGYFQSVHYTDKQIGMFLDLLDKEGLLDNTVVMVEGDHSGVHKYYNSMVESLSNPEDWWLDNGNPVVPFLIYQNNLKEPLKSDTYGGQIDMMPTLLYLLGVDESKYIDTVFGRNLLKTNKSFALLNNRSVKGELSEEDIELYTNAFDLSDKMIRSNYFSKYKKLD